MSPITPKVNDRRSTEERIELLIVAWRSHNNHNQPLPPIETIALITGARSVSLVKSVLYDMGITA